MIVVKIELWPGGDDTKMRMLGAILITNDGKGTEEVGNYKYHILHGGKYFGKKGTFKKGKVVGFLRKLSPYRLVYKVLKHAGEVT